MIVKSGSAHWTGSLEQGRGTVSTESTALTTQPYGFNTRFEDAPGTNPEELVGAAHAACYAMALSLELGKADLEAEDIDVTSKISLEKVPDGFAVTKAHLHVRAKIPGASEDQFRTAAEATKTGCPISKLLNAEITMEAELL